MAMSLASGYKVTYPIFIDTESASNGRANGLSKSARTAVVKAFCQTSQKRRLQSRCLRQQVLVCKPVECIRTERILYLGGTVQFQLHIFRKI